MNFFTEYLKVVNNNLSNRHKNNWDINRYGREPKQSLKEKALTSFKDWINQNGFFNLRHFVNKNLENVPKFKFLFDELETDEDRELLLMVLAYRIMGSRKVKLPLNTPTYWKKLKALEDLAEKSDSINPGFMHFSLKKMNLQQIGYPLSFYFTPGGIMIDFIIKQYEYNKGSVQIKAEKGDVVIDGGGCWGDTALYFANEAGSDGKVYSFEFIPNNIAIFEMNISMNMSLKDNIDLIRNPLWKDSSTKIYFKDLGPGSMVSMDPLPNGDGECTTMSIDELVRQKGLEKVDFIKMDIEGAETNALRGAVETIRKFKPKLAIALYHSFEDFDQIPRLIREIEPGYKFYFSHCTIYGEESILFAKAN